MARIIKQEKQWLNEAKDKLSILSKRRIFNHWKLFKKAKKIEMKYENRLKTNSINGLRQEIECNLKEKQIATSHWWRKGKGRLFFNEWWNLTCPHYKKKKLEQKASQKYNDKLKTDAISMFKEFISESKRAKTDEFLSLGMNQDYVEIGIVQINMHRY